MEKMKQIIQKLKEIKELLKDEKHKEFEDKNFRVNSDGFKKVTVDDVSYLQNEDKDIFELLEGEFTGEQLFTYESAIRETKKAGKTMSTVDVFKEMIKDTDDIKGWKKVGYRDYSSAGLNGQGSLGYYWSSTPFGTNAYNLSFNSSSVNPANSKARAYGFSVRCVKD